MKRNNFFHKLFNPIKNDVCKTANQYREKLCKVLIVDDVSTNRYIIKKYIEKATRGHHSNTIIEEAVDANEAINMFSRNNHNIIFMDIKMPGMSGIEATKIILQKNPNVVIYGCTGQIEKETVKEATKSGMMFCIAKPVSYNCIYDIFNSHLLEDN